MQRTLLTTFAALMMFSELPLPVSADDKEDNNTPGFLGVTVILATLGAVLFARMRQEDEV
jgi:hypothetical protein